MGWPMASAAVKPNTRSAPGFHLVMMPSNVLLTIVSSEPIGSLDMPSIQGFPPIANANATRLVLGSMPGRASLHAQQYYAHPRNSFWRLVEATLGIAATLPYDARCEALVGCGIAVWDVLAQCRRDGSLDSAIDDSSLVANDFATFLDAHPRIAAIYFNGAKAEHSYRKHVLPHLSAEQAGIALRRLPSTSPANASYSFERKLAAWAVIGAAR